MTGRLDVGRDQEARDCFDDRQKQTRDSLNSWGSVTVSALPLLDRSPSAVVLRS